MQELREQHDCCKCDSVANVARVYVSGEKYWTCDNGHVNKDGNGRREE